MRFSDLSSLLASSNRSVVAAIREFGTEGDLDPAYRRKVVSCGLARVGVIRIYAYL